MINQLKIVPLAGVKMGFEAFVPSTPGAYLLYLGSAQIASEALTYGGTGSLYILDTNPIVKEIDGVTRYFVDMSKTRFSDAWGDITVPNTKMRDLEPGESRVLFHSTPVTVGMYQALVPTRYSLVVHIMGGTHGVIPVANIYYAPLR